MLPAVVVALIVGWGSRWAGRRGWVCNKHNPRPRGVGAVGLFEQLYQPSIEHVVEERSAERTRAQRVESGDKPEARSDKES